MNKLFAFFLVTFCFASCGPVDTHPLIGAWQNSRLEVEINSFGGTDKDSTVLATKEDWEKVMKIKPIQTTFKNDSSWVSNYYNINGNLIFTSSGKWWTNDELLFMQTLEPKKEIIQYKYRVEGNTSFFIANVDWDSDGIPDDLYMGEQELIKE